MEENPQATVVMVRTVLSFKPLVQVNANLP